MNCGWDMWIDAKGIQREGGGNKRERIQCYKSRERMRKRKAKEIVPFMFIHIYFSNSANVEIM